MMSHSDDEDGIPGSHDTSVIDQTVAVARNPECQTTRKVGDEAICGRQQQQQQQQQQHPSSLHHHLVSSDADVEQIHPSTDASASATTTITTISSISSSSSQVPAHLFQNEELAAVGEKSSSHCDSSPITSLPPREDNYPTTEEDGKDDADIGFDLSVGSRLKRKKAVKIKRSKTDESCNKLFFRRCNSLLDVERKKLVCVPINSSQISLDNFPVSCDVIGRLHPGTPDKLGPSGGESDNDVLSGTDGSCFSPVETGQSGRDCLSPVGVNQVGRLYHMEAQLSECLSPVEGALDGLFRMESHVGRRSPHEILGGTLDGRTSRVGSHGSIPRDSNRDSVYSAVVEPEARSIFRRRKSGSGQFRLSEVNKELTLVDATTTKKRSQVFRRKSSLVEEDRKPVTKKIFGTSKTSLQLLRKYSLASEYFTLKFDGAENNGEEQMVAAQKGMALGEAMADCLQRRGLSPDQVDVFLESSKTPLPLSSDCFLLANTTLWVRAKDDTRRTESNLKNVSSVSTPLVSASSSSSTLSSSIVAPFSDQTKDKKLQNGSLRNKKSVSSEDNSNSSSYQDVGPYGSLSHNDVQKYRGTIGAMGGTAGVGVGGTAAGGAKGHGSKLQSLFNPFSKVQDKQEQLNELLTNYSLHGLPKMPDLLTLGRPHYDLQVFDLESHWTDIVKNHHLLNKRQRDQQEAIWELLTTEVEYIQKLKVIMDLFMCCLFNLQNEQLLNEIEADKLFSNIGDVFYSTCHFWNIHMSQVLKQARERREPLNPCLLKAGFLVFEKIFEPYTKYCLEQDNCREYIKSKTKENELFRTFIVWAESQKPCNRLKLVDLIVKPFQRLTKYKLLLYAMRKPLDKMEVTTDVEEQKKDINVMVEQVENFVFKVNVAMRQRYDYKQMSQMIDRIESYDAIEAPSEECIKLVSKFCKLDLTCPVPGCGQQQMRILLLEGNLKLRDTYSKMDVYCFLFTDMLLITKPAAKRGEKVKVIKPPMRLDKIVVHSLRDVASFMLLYLNEYHMAQAVYTFQGDSKLWLENVTKAQNDYKEKRNSYLMRTDLYDDVDDDCTIYIEHVSSSADMSRHDSSSSADIFLPNYGVQRSTSCVDDQTNIRGGAQPTTAADNSRPSSALQNRDPSYRSQLSVPYLRGGKNNSSSESLASTESKYLTVPGDQTLTRDAATDGVDPSELDYGSQDEEPEPVEESKFRPNQRRGGRGERRYRTADTIQDLRNRKDRNIQKRLSWNCGNSSAANLEDKEKLFGCDSMRSMPSSSGVSSTVSLHAGDQRIAPPDDDCDDFGADLDQLGPCRVDGCPHRVNPRRRTVETQTRKSDWRNAVDGEEDDQWDDEKLSFGNERSGSLSKSLPNIAGLVLANCSGEDDDLVGVGRGEAVVDLPAASMPSTPRIFHRRTLSGPQSSATNKELILFNSTLEASEV